MFFFFKWSLIIFDNNELRKTNNSQNLFRIILFKYVHLDACLETTGSTNLLNSWLARYIRFDGANWFLKCIIFNPTNKNNIQKSRNYVIMVNVPIIAGPIEHFRDLFTINLINKLSNLEVLRVKCLLRRSPLSTIVLSSSVEFPKREKSPFCTPAP